MPYIATIDCPRCERPLTVRRGGKCPHCGTWVADHVARSRLREKRIEQVIAVLSTAAVLALFLWAGGVGLLEGVAVYAVVGFGVWYWGKGTFWSETLSPERLDDGAPAEAQPDAERARDVDDGF